jgi:hypothetical protein
VKRLVLVAAALLALAGAATAAADLPTHRSGSIVGEGLPLKAYATLRPTVTLFGDVLTAKLAVIADTKWVDAQRLRVHTDFAPYAPVKDPVVLRLRVGRFEQVTWTWKLRCLESACVPRDPPSDAYHLFQFHPAHVSFGGTKAKPAYGIDAHWPRIETISQMTPGLVKFLQLTRHINWRFQLAPIASPTYRVSPSLLFWLALALAGLLGVAALGLTGRWLVRTRGVPEATPVAPGTQLERALAVLRYAHERGDETLQRKAFERVATELGVERAGELRVTARELAWSPRTPEDEEIEVFAVQALDTEDDS